jgi:hypothetical protein
MIHQDSSRFIKIHQNSSKFIKIHQDPLKRFPPFRSINGADVPSIGTRFACGGSSPRSSSSASPIKHMGGTPKWMVYFMENH